MRVQVIYGEYAEADFACRTCGGSGAGPAGRITREICWTCLGAGNLVADQRAYTYEAPEGTKLWDVLVTPTPQQGGKRGTVVRLGSDYAGPCREAFPIPRPRFPCLGGCGTLLESDGRGRMPVFCAACSAVLPETIRGRLDGATGAEVFHVMAEAKTFMEVYRIGHEDGAREQAELSTPDPWREEPMGWSDGS